jgi:hypothetical protein
MQMSTSNLELIKEEENLQQCRNCRQWFDRNKLDIELYGYCEPSCLEDHYRNFKHLHLARRLNDVPDSK